MFVGVPNCGYSVHLQIKHFQNALILRRNDTLSHAGAECLYYLACFFAHFYPQLMGFVFYSRARKEVGFQTATFMWLGFHGWFLVIKPLWLMESLGKFSVKENERQQAQEAADV